MALGCKLLSSISAFTISSKDYLSNLRLLICERVEYSSFFETNLLNYVISHNSILIMSIENKTKQVQSSNNQSNNQFCIDVISAEIYNESVYKETLDRNIGIIFNHFKNNRRKVKKTL